MKKHEQDDLVQIAGAVSDGTPVDWEQEKKRSPALRPALEHLAVLERIRDLHRAPTGLTDAAGAVAVSSARTETIEAGAGSAPLPIASWGSLRILEKVGEGGWGEVFRAFDPSLETDVALKLLKPGMEANPAALENFVTEARRLARVRHSNVLIVHGADRHDGRAGIWTELIRGESLEEHVRREGPMSAQEAVNVGLELCKALSAMHTAHLIHRDVKASNVMREEGGRIVLMDFGSVTDSPRPGTTGSTRHIHGTPICMSPEQLRGEVAGPATDVYCLGALLYYLVSTKFPVEARSHEELVRAHREQRYVPLLDRRADVPLGFARVVEKALDPDPAARFASAGSMARALTTALGDEVPGWLTWLRGHGGVVAAAATVAAALVVIASWPRDRDAVPAPPPAPAALTATVELRRVEGNEERPVPPGSSLKVGDKLSMLVTPAERMHVYVLNEDAEGRVIVLFPLGDAGIRNPLEARRPYRLPGSTDSDSLINWDVNTVGGEETIVALGTREPLARIDSVFAALPRAEWNQPYELPEGVLMQLRGIGGMSVGPPAPKAEQRRGVDVLLEWLKLRREQLGDVWIWQTVLPNP
jgi:hypothetical protein